MLDAFLVALTAGLIGIAAVEVCYQSRMQQRIQAEIRWLIRHRIPNAELVQLLEMESYHDILTPYRGGGCALIRQDQQLMGLRFTVAAHSRMSRPWSADVPLELSWFLVAPQSREVMVTMADGSRVPYMVCQIPGVTDHRYLEQQIRQEFPNMAGWSLV